MRMVRRITFPWVLCLCCFCGTAAGAVMANCLGDELIGQLGLFSSVYYGSGILSRIEKRRLWGYVARQRLSEFGLAVLVGLTPFSAAGFAAIAFAGGFCLGFLHAAMTLLRGLAGILSFLAVLMPQWLCYLPAWVILAVRAENGLIDLKPRDWLLPALLVLAGTGLEAWVNPWLLCF